MITPENVVDHYNKHTAAVLQENARLREALEDALLALPSEEQSTRDEIRTVLEDSDAE